MDIKKMADEELLEIFQGVIADLETSHDDLEMDIFKIVKKEILNRMDS